MLEHRAVLFLHWAGIRKRANQYSVQAAIKRAKPGQPAYPDVLQGFDVLQASNEVGAITLSEQYPQIDLIVCDIAVGTSSGTEIALKLRKARPNLRVLFVSGTPMNAWEKRDMNNFLKLPVDSVDCLEKPFRPAAFLRKVKELLTKRSQRLPGMTAGDAR